MRIRNSSRTTNFLQISGLLVYFLLLPELPAHQKGVSASDDRMDKDKKTNRKEGQNNHNHNQDFDTLSGQFLLYNFRILEITLLKTTNGAQFC